MAGHHNNVLLFSMTGDVSTEETLHLQDANFDALNPQFTLSCTSTGGPATTVTWMRDSERVGDNSVRRHRDCRVHSHTDCD